MSDDDSGGGPRWLLYVVPLVMLVVIVMLSLLYAHFVTPHLRPRWLGADSPLLTTAAS